MKSKIAKYWDFINESINNELELLLEANIKYKKGFVDMLNVIDSPISRKIKSLELNDVDVNTNYIDIDTTKNDFILFIPDDKAEKKDFVVENPYKELFHSSQRAVANGYDIKNLGSTYAGQKVQVVKILDDADIKQIIGDDSDETANAVSLKRQKIAHIRFKSDAYEEPREMLFPYGELTRDIKDIKPNPFKIGKFVTNLLTKAGVEFDNKDVEEFVNRYKAEMQKTKDAFKRFEVVKDEDIRKYYLEENYINSNGTLGGSCMRYRKCQKYLDIYTGNDTASLIIFRSADDNSKIMGRALLWDAVQKTTGKKIKFMDRVYVNNYSDIELFKQYAIDHNFHYKKNQDYSDYPLMFNGEDLSKDDSMIIVKLRDSSYSYYPYVDTVTYFVEGTFDEFEYDEDVEKDEDDEYYGAYLTNDTNDDYAYELTSTSGNAEDCDSCGGSGRHSCYDCDGRGNYDCDDCDGRGEISCGECYGEGDYDCGNCEGTGEVDTDCEECDGTGVVGDDDDECDNCNGNGTTSTDCGDCNGDGKISCDECNGDGEITCGSCDGEGDFECSTCDGDGDLECDECN